jgi:hypothetical protein
MSALSLGYKLAHFEFIKAEWGRQQELVAQKDELLAELNASGLDPDVAAKMTATVNRSSLFSPNQRLSLRSVPEPTEFAALGNAVPGCTQITVAAVGTARLGPSPIAAASGGMSELRVPSDLPDHSNPVTFSYASHRGSAPAAPGLSVAESDAAMVRGVCAGCGQSVLGNQGREREGDSYYHAGCIKGRCAECGLIVHANSVGEVNINGQFYHTECFDQDDLPHS